MNYEMIFQKLWQSYAAQNPSVKAIHNLLKSRDGKPIVNDHIALRTIADPRVDIMILAKAFQEKGYKIKGNYDFPAKRLDAIHLEHESDLLAPKVFISQLRYQELSAQARDCIHSCIDAIPAKLLEPEALLFAERPWPAVSFETYKKLADESEYASWWVAHGYRANHFTVFVNQLREFEQLEALNDFLLEHHYQLNTSGGVIKGTPEQLLEQSSTLADEVEVEFADGKHIIPGCYYEFAKRYALESGELYQGFIAASADKIFESTDRH